jgi:pimeloyl-ACP methyl ester carboxylesterase
VSSAREAYADVNGTRLCYEARGSGPSILLLHGFALDRRMWRPQLEALSEDFRVVAYDTRGFGRSAMPETEPFRHCDDAAALVESLGLAPVVAVGHSIGAHHMLELAITRPDLVRAYVAVCPSGLAGTPFPPAITATFAAIKRCVKEGSIEAAKAEWGKCAWFDSSRGNPELEGELGAMLADYSGWHWTHDNPVQNIVPPAAERLAEVTQPTVVMSGARDIEYNTVIADRLCRGIQHAKRLILPDAGHMASMEAPATVSRAIAEVARAR